MASVTKTTHTCDICENRAVGDSRPDGWVLLRVQCYSKYFNKWQEWNDSELLVCHACHSVSSKHLKEGRGTLKKVYAWLLQYF